MKELNLFSIQEKGLVSVSNDRVVTTSLQVAEYFGKEHKNVLKAIREIDCDPHFTQLNFEPCMYISELKNGVKRELPMYYITRDGFTLLAMGFTGKKAMQFKIAYINAFNQMEEILRSGQENKYALSVLKSELAKLNRNLKNSVITGRMKYGNAFGPAGDIPSGFSLLEDYDFIQNVKNLMAHVNNAMLTAYFLNKELQSKDKTIEEMQQAIKIIRLEAAKILGY